jgi:hypothetical protein
MAYMFAHEKSVNLRSAFTKFECGIYINLKSFLIKLILAEFSIVIALDADLYKFLFLS